jgi:AraC family transcriptional regulator
MEVEVREIAPRKAVAMSHRGPYHEIGRTFGQLAGWLKEKGIEAGPFVGLYYDDPSTTPPADLKSDAGALVPDGFSTNDPRVHIIDVGGGKYAVATHVGPYHTMGESWTRLMGEWFPASGCAHRMAPGLEIYVDDCDTVGPENARTELCAPVTAPA